MTTITEEQALKRLTTAARTETQARLATRLGITPQYLNDVLNRRRGAQRVLERFGLRRVVRYEEAT